MDSIRGMDSINRRAAGLPGILIAAGVPAAIVFLLNPLLIAWSNIQDMELPLGTLAGGAFLFAFLAFLLGAAMLWLAERLGWRRVVPLAMAAGVMIWLHSAVLVWDYGVLDGTTIDWRVHRVAGMVELLLWIGVLVWAFRQPELVRRIGARVLPALLLVHGANVALAAWNAPEAPSFHTYGLSKEDRSLFSSERNVIFIVLDAFQSDVFAELLHEHPELTGQFEGFTYYRNAVAGFSKTYPSPALMLSGRYYENQEPLQQFLKRVYLEESVPAKLVAAGWDVGLYPYVSRTLHFDPAVASNIRRERDAELVEVASLLDLGLFRAAPHFAKRSVVNDHEWRFRRYALHWARTRASGTNETGGLWRSAHRHHDVRFVEELEHNARLGAEAPVFRYFHFLAPHAPFLLNEAFEMEKLEGGRRGFRRYSNVALGLVERVFAKLREMGIYDDTAILIVSDHGGGEYGAGIDGRFAGRKFGSDYAPGMSRFEHASGLPLMLLKLPNAAGSLRISDAPVSLGDVAATLDALTLDAGGYPGVPIHRVDEDDRRERRYLFYKFDGWMSEYLPPLKEFLVEGFAWDPAAWRTTGRIFEGETAPDEPVEASTFVPVGKPVSTAANRAGQRALGDGWWTGEETMTWSRGTRSELHLRFAEKLAGDVPVTLRFRPHLGRGTLEQQRVIVRHEGKKLAQFEARSHGNYRFFVPLGPEGKDAIDLVLEVPDAISPAQALSSTDARVLGIALYEFQVGAPLELQDGDELHFGAADEGAALLRDGWSEPEARFTWTDGSHASLNLPLAEDLHGQVVRLRFGLRPFVAAPEVQRQRVNVFANGTAVGEWEVDDGGKYTVTLPVEITAQGVVDLVFELPDAAVPMAVSNSGDIRTLGIALFKIDVAVE